MDELRFLSSSPSFTKPTQSPARQRTDSASVIQQSDVSSSRPTLLAHDALGPLLFEALDGFFFTINHNFELDFVSDNVSQYLKFSQEELARRNLCQCVHPSDVSEFSQVWTEKDAGESLTTAAASNGESSRGKTFLCRMRTNDEANPYLPMLLSVALHRDPSTSDKTFLVCIARRSSANEPKDKSAILGFDQFSSRINLQFDIESFDGSHMKHETLDMNYQGKNFRSYVHNSDLPSIGQHFQDVIEKGESKSAIYRFRLHDDIYAFVISQSKLFNNGNSHTADCIMSTHTIIRLSESPIDLNGNASTRLVKSIVASQRDLQRNKPSQASPSPRTPACTPPIGTNFALTMFGMHRNSSNTLQQHVSNTLGSLAHVQSSFSGATNSPLDRSLTQTSVASPARVATQKSSILDNVSSSETVEFGSNRTPFSPFGSVHSNAGPLASPMNNTFDSIFSPSNDLDIFFAPTSPNNLLPKKSNSSPTDLTEFSTNDLFGNPNTTNSISTTPHTTPSTTRTSLRLRRLLTTKSPPTTSPSPSHGLAMTPDLRSQPSNHFDDSNPTLESPTTTSHQSPLSAELPSPNLRRRKASQTNGGISSSLPTPDLLLKQILNRQTPMNNNTLATSNATNISPAETNSLTPPIKTEAVTNDENTANGQTTNNSPGASNKLRSDIFLRTLLKDEVRPQKVVVEPPFTYATRTKPAGRASGGATLLLGPTQNRSIGSQSRSTGLKSQMSLDTIESAIWDAKGKKKRQNSHTFGSRNNSMTSMLAANATRKSTRTKRDTSDYLLGNPSMDNSLDAFFDNPDAASIAPKSPIGLQRPVRQASISAMGNLKRLADQDEAMSNPRKYPRLLTQALKDDVKVEATDQTIISPSIALAATRPLHQPHPQIKTEPEIVDSIGGRRSLTNLSSVSQSPLLRHLIRTNQAGAATKKDAPLYDLLQNLDANDTSIFSTINSISANKASAPIDPLEQYLNSSTPPNNNKPTSKDDYLAALLSADPQQPSEISFVPLHKQQSTPNLHRSTSTSSETSRIAAMVNELFNATAGMQPNASTPTPTTTAPPPTAAAAPTTTHNPTEDLLSMLDNRDFLDCFNDSSTIDSILSENPTSILSSNPPSTSIPSTSSKNTEKDERAISEIYKTLVTSFNPGPSALDLPVENSPFNSLPGDFLFAENPPNSAPPNRTVTMDPLMSPYRPANNYSYQPPPHPSQTQAQPSSNTSQFSDCLSMDMIDNSNTFPPNVSLSPMTNTYHSSSTNPPSSHMDPSNPMMMYPQSAPTHIQHHQPNSSMGAHYYRQAPMYNNYSSAPPPNQVAPQTGYYSMQQAQAQAPAQQQQQQQQGRIPSGHHPSQMGKRPGMMHPQRATLLPPQSANPNNQQVQLHMSMNVTLPHVNAQQNQQRAMMNTYNDLMHQNNSQDFSTYPPNNSLDHSFGHDLFMSSSPSSQQAPPPQQQQQQQQQASPMMHQRHMQQQQQQQQQSYSNMNMVPTNNLNPMDCRPPDDLNNQMMNSLSFQPTRFTSEFVRKQLQNTIHGRQKPSNAGKDMSSGMVAPQKMMNPTNNLDANQKGAYFRHQLASPMSTPPLQSPMRHPSQQQPQLQSPPQQQQQQNKPPM